MMAGLELTGPLNLTGRLVLNASGGKVKAGGFEVLVQLSAPGEPHHGTASPVILPPPSASPLDTGPNVWVIGSFNQRVTIGAKPIVALGMVMQGQTPMWPGMVLPSQKNKQPKAVSVNGVPANVQDDQAMIFPTGVPAALGTSGQ
jgi:hypothetical protein